MKLTRLVQEWFWEEMEHVPARDPRRTPECLDFEAIEAAARLPEATPATQLAHIVGCDWCRKNWLAFQQLHQESPATVPPVDADRTRVDVSPIGVPSIGVPPIGVSPLQLTSMAWTPEYTVMVSQYLSSASYLACENSEATPAHFDSEGTLRVHWSGLDYEGPVSVSLLIDGTPQFLTSGIVSHGMLQVVEPLAHLGQRNVELPFSVLHLEPIGLEPIGETNA